MARRRTRFMDADLGRKLCGGRKCDQLVCGGGGEGGEGRGRVELLEATLMSGVEPGATIPPSPLLPSSTPSLSPSPPSHPPPTSYPPSLNLSTSPLPFSLPLFLLPLTQSHYLAPFPSLSLTPSLPSLCSLHSRSIPIIIILSQHLVYLNLRTYTAMHSYCIHMNVFRCSAAHTCAYFVMLLYTQTRDFVCLSVHQCTQ